MRVFTICTQSYLAFAGVLAESLAQTHDGLRLSVVLIDGDASTKLDFADVILPTELPLGDAAEFHRMATIYDVVELSTALKPWAFQYLFARFNEPVLYLDPDIQVFAPLHDLGELADAHGILINPHTMKPLPRDGLMPTERDLLISGTYNLGFIGVGLKGAPFLDWWAERLRRECLNSIEDGYFVDQRWIDLVPSYFPHFVLRDPGCNVAYWNLPNRHVQNGDGNYRVDGVPLRFFHFSGFSADAPHLLSKHQGERPRIRLTEQPALASLCREYAKRLRRHGSSRYARLPYRYETAANGMQLVRAIRRAYRRELVRQEAAGQTSTLPDPFTPDGAEQLVEFLREPSRYLYEVYRERPELHSAFPDVPGGDTQRFVDWVRQDGEEIPDELLPGRKPLARGVNLYGYVFAESGTGQIGRSIVAALQAAGIPYAVIPFVETVNRQQHAFAADANAVYDTNLICVNADQVPVFLEKMGAETLERRYNIGVWAWEVDDMPEPMARNGDYFDEVWGISEYTAEGVRRRVRVPVRAFPLPVVAPPAVERSRRELGLPEGFLALFCFDFGSVFERKNPLAVVEAFRRAFPKPGQAQLCIKTVNGDRHAADLQRLRDACADRNDIVLIDGYRSAEEQMALMQSCDVYVSLHRAEGFGLTVAEAMALGKPVITTAWSSTMEFTTEENSYLVPATVVPVPKGTPVYPSTAQWAEPDVDAAAAALRRVYEHRDEANAIGERARRDIVELHSAEARAPRLKAMLEPKQSRRTRKIAPPPTAALAADERAAALIAGPRPQMPSRMPWLANLWRKLMLRLIRNYWVHEREVDRALLGAVRSSRESVRLEMQTLEERIERIESVLVVDRERE
ncbi:MAG TPA: glycosyltransferase family 4 protein [Thermoanaerobaculia bacterium]|nr:glycosyltransferase family 4 protein [Thermoanaerobaculia bacterium]